MKQVFTLGLIPELKEDLCSRGFPWLKTQDELAMNVSSKGPQVA